MRAARITVVVALLVAVGAIAVVLLSSGSSYTVTADVTDAGQIIKGNEVRIGGSAVGTVSAVRLTRSGHAELELSLDRSARPLRRGTTLAIRSTSLAGSANHYVVLVPGALSQPKIPDGGRLDVLASTAPVDFDVVLNAFDGATRRGLGELVRGAGQQHGTRTAQSRLSLARLAPALGGSSAVLRELARDREALNGLIVRGAVAARAVASEQAHLVSAIDHASTTMAAIGADQGALGTALVRLPPTLHQADRTFAGLRTTLDALDPLVATAKPATHDLASFLRRLRPVLTAAVPVLGDLAPLLRQAGRGNDLVDLVGGLPRLARTTAAAAPDAVRAMDGSQPIADQLLAYTPDIAAAAARLGQAASYYDANGHYLRLQPTLLPFAYDAGTHRLVPHADAARLDGLQTGKGARCPGSAALTGAGDVAPVVAAGCQAGGSR